MIFILEYYVKDSWVFNLLRELNNPKDFLLNCLLIYKLPVLVHLGAIRKLT